MWPWHNVHKFVADNIISVNVQSCPIHREMFVQLIDDGTIVAPNLRYEAAFTHLKKSMGNACSNADTPNTMAKVDVRCPKITMSWKDADPLTPRVVVGFKGLSFFNAHIFIHLI